jgi:hypothetical protein
VCSTPLLLEKRVLQLLKKNGFMSGHIFATHRGSSGLFQASETFKVLATLKNL